MLYIIATPIGDPKDISLRALETLKACPVVIGEERREASTLLKRLEVGPKELYLLNEHSKPEDLQELVQLCQSHDVALISDCGTPSFYDPGYQLVHLCRQRKIKISSLPGASSLMTLLSLVSQKVTQFYFAGFLPADSEIRQSHLKQLLQRQDALVLMDTPYRLQKLLSELDLHAKHQHLLLGLNLTQSEEWVLEGAPGDLLQCLKDKGVEKAEFILLIYEPKTKNSHSLPLRGSFKKKAPSHPSERNASPQNHRSRFNSRRPKSK